MIKVGLTGGFGSGKTTVSSYLATQGIPIIDADQIARDVTTPPSDLLDQLIQTFGKEYLTNDGHLDRRKLGLHVFQNNEAKQQLNEIILPAIRSEINTALSKAEQQGYDLAIVDAPTLYESGLDQAMDINLVVWAPDDLRRKRLKQQRQFSDQEITQRFEAQWPLQEKADQADYVIDNSKTAKAAQEAALQIIKQIVEST